MSKEKKQSIINGALVLVLSTVLVKVIGAIFKIPLTSLIGGTGRGYFSTAYNIYTPVYAVALAGLPTAVSKLVSQHMALGDYGYVKKIRSVAWRLFLVTGILGTGILMLVAYPYAKYVAGTMGVMPSILAIAPSIFFCCLMSSCRGYFEGKQNMTPTAVSQVIEALSKLACGLLFAWWVMQKLGAEYQATSTVLGVAASSQEEALSMIYPYTAAAAVLGVTAGTVFGLLYLMAYSGFHPMRITGPCEVSSRTVAKELIFIAIPVVLGSLVQNVSNLIDTATIQNRLESALRNDTFGVIERMYSQSLSISGTVKADIKTYLFGVYNSALDFKNLVPTVTLALGISALPAISRARTLGQRKDMEHIINSVLKFAMILGTPVGFGMAALPEELLRLVYQNSNPDLIPIAAPIVRSYGIFMFLFAVSGPLISLLQGIGRAGFTVKSILIGAVIKVALNWILVGNPAYNINGAPISTTFCYVIIVALNLGCLMKETGAHIRFVQVFLKPVTVSLFCVVLAKIAYTVLRGKAPDTLLLAAVVLVCAVVYLFLLLVTKIIDKNDLSLLFKSEKMGKTLEKLGRVG